MDIVNACRLRYAAVRVVLLIRHEAEALWIKVKNPRLLKTHTLMRHCRRQHKRRRGVFGVEITSSALYHHLRGRDYWHRIWKQVHLHQASIIIVPLSVRRGQINYLSPTLGLLMWVLQKRGRDPEVLDASWAALLAAQIIWLKLSWVSAYIHLKMVMVPARSRSWVLSVE